MCDHHQALLGAISEQKKKLFTFSTKMTFLQITAEKSKSCLDFFLYWGVWTGMQHMEGVASMIRATSINCKMKTNFIESSRVNMGWRTLIPSLNWFLYPFANWTPLTQNHDARQSIDSAAAGQNQPIPTKQGLANSVGLQVGKLFLNFKI